MASTLTMKEKGLTMLHRKAFSLLLLPVSLTLLASCASTGTKVEQSALLAFQKGQTPCAEVIQTLGPPNLSHLRDDGSRQLVYSYTQVQAKWQNFVPVVGAVAQGATAETTETTLECSPAGILVGYVSSKGQTKSGYGLSSGAKQ